MSSSQTPLWFEDAVPGQCLTSSAYTIERDKLLTFAQQWDPLEIHLNERAGAEAFGSLTAPGLYMLAVKQRLIHRLPPQNVFASLGYDEVRFHAPLRPGDIVVLHQEWLSCRLSASKPKLGIVTMRFELVNQNDEIVLSHKDTVLVHRRTDI